jgi:peptidyl-prolyl cis-trans isomerase C
MAAGSDPPPERIVMRSPLRPAAALALAAGLLVVPAAAQQGQPAAASDPVVARVNGAEIRRSEVAAEQQTLPQELRAVPLDAIFPHLLRRMIDSRLLVAEARRKGLQGTPEVQTRVAALERRVLEEALLSSEIAGKVSEEALRKRYETFVKANQGQVQIRARHILVATEGEAAAIIAELGKPGGDFAKLARERSKDSSAARGGDLGFFQREDMVKPFADAAFQLKPGETTKAPVQTRFGWHVIKVEERRSAPVPSFEEARETLGRDLSEEAATRLVESLRAGAKVEMLVPEDGPAPGAPGQPAEGAAPAQPPARTIQPLPAQPLRR